MAFTYKCLDCNREADWKKTTDVCPACKGQPHLRTESHEINYDCEATDIRTETSEIYCDFCGGTGMRYVCGHCGINYDQSSWFKRR